MRSRMAEPRSAPPIPHVQDCPRPLIVKGVESQGVFTWENSHRREFHTGMTFLFRIAFTLWLDHFISLYLKVHFMLRFKITNITHALPVPVYQQTDFTPKCVLHMMPLRDFVPEWNSRPGATTGVSSRRGDSRWHDIFWWYHVNKFRIMRWNRS